MVIVKGEECQCPAESNADVIHKNVPCGEGKFRDPLEILGSLQIRFFYFNFYKTPYVCKCVVLPKILVH